MTKIHVFPSSGQAYDESQWRDDIEVPELPRTATQSRIG